MGPPLPRSLESRIQPTPESDEPPAVEPVAVVVDPPGAKLFDDQEPPARKTKPAKTRKRSR